MSELTETNVKPRNIRWELLATASALTLVNSIGLSAPARAEHSDRSTVWLEIGTQLEGGIAKEEPFAPSFVDTVVNAGFKSPALLEGNLPQSYGAEGKITFSPGNSVWKFSAAARYGRSHGTKRGHQEKDAVPSDFPSSIIPRPTYIVNFADTRTETSEAHTIVDFQVGRDVGLGFFTDRADSEINFGVRFAQFNYESTNELYARPDFTLGSKYFPTFQRSIPVHHTYHLYHANSHSTRSFQGIGPSLSWEGSQLVVGSEEDGEISLDWGATFSVLFGRQKVKANHSTTSDHYSGFPYNNDGIVKPKYHTHSGAHSNPMRSRSVVVPNIGAFGGASYRFPNAKLSVGYRADFFFGAMDTGIDTSQRSTTAFHGPYATLSIGLGG